MGSTLITGASSGIGEALARALEQHQVAVVPGRVTKLIVALERRLPDGAAGALSSTFSRRYRREP
ncbi:MAG: hypothetical protein VKN17_00330 [Cyanobacteriota bacterium]|jgi:NADP-dependent 3-hydroxy acid dehydrogenase YdfG|nr:hypothetical protein [Cyanobacteriota bacterium]